MKSAKLRVCASCEWIFTGSGACPKCGFISYGAHWVYGKKAYRHAESQEPWKTKKMNRYEAKLDEEIHAG